MKLWQQDSYPKESTLNWRLGAPELEAGTAEVEERLR